MDLQPQRRPVFLDPPFQCGSPHPYHQKTKTGPYLLVGDRLCAPRPWDVQGRRSLGAFPASPTPCPPPWFDREKGIDLVVHNSDSGMVLCCCCKTLPTGGQGPPPPPGLHRNPPLPNPSITPSDIAAGERVRCRGWRQDGCPDSASWAARMSCCMCTCAWCACGASGWLRRCRRGHTCNPSLKAQLNRHPPLIPWAGLLRVCTQVTLAHTWGALGEALASHVPLSNGHRRACSLGL